MVLRKISTDALFHSSATKKIRNNPERCFYCVSLSLRLLPLPLHGKVKKIFLSVHRMDLIPVMK